MKRLLLLILALVVVSILYWWLSTSPVVEEKAFSLAVKDTSAIEEIELTSSRGEVVRLTRKDQGWMVNDSFKVRKNAILNLLDAVRRVELQSIPPKSAGEVIMKDIKNNGVKVKITGNGGRLLKTYYVGGTTPDERGTFMLTADKSTPMVTYIPGWEGGLSRRYWMSVQEWRSRRILAEDPLQILKLAVYYPRQEKYNFVLRQENGNYILLQRDNEKSVLPDQSIVKNYLEEFRTLYAESIILDTYVRDTMAAGLPFANFSLLRKDHSSMDFQLFPVNEDIGGIYQDRYFLRTGEGEVFLIQHRLAKDLLRGYDFFLTIN